VHVTALAAALLVAVAVQPSAGARQRPSEHWVGTWFAASTARLDPPSPPAAGAPAGTSGQSLLHFSNQTLRQIVHITLGGARLRVVIANTFGATELRIGAASVALRDHESAIVPQSTRPLTFGGAAQKTIPAGAMATSDPVDLAAPDFTDLAIDLYLPGDTSAMRTITTHPASWQTGYVSQPGNHAGATTIPVQATTRYRRSDGLESATWFLLTRVEVMAPAEATAIVAIGDSITDGTASGLDSNNRWPDHLARRLASAGGGPIAVLNAGIGGNRVLAEGNGPAALARFDRDVLSQPGAAAVIVLEGINDIGQARANPSPSAADLIAGHTQLIEQAHARGLRVYGATLTPFEGANYWTPEGEAKRQQLNDWIRTGHAYDGVFDFDAAVRDPSHPGKTLARFDAGDHLHLNAAGYEAVAQAIDLARLRPRHAMQERTEHP
jgi:lysophospholipase L1-like esterase